MILYSAHCIIGWAGFPNPHLPHPPSSVYILNEIFGGPVVLGAKIGAEGILGQKDYTINHTRQGILEAVI